MSTTTTQATFCSQDLRICELIKSLNFIPEVIYDIGGSNGAWTRNILSVYPDAQFILFEPQADTNPQYGSILFPFLENRPQISLRREIISNEDSQTRLRLVGDNGVGASILPGSDCDSITVPSRKLDSMIVDQSIPRGDLIKMDIQGAELMALQGGTEQALPHATVLALELWTVRGYGKATPLLGEVNAFLKEYDFFPFDFGDVYRSPNGVLAAQDVWYCRNSTPLAKQIWPFGI